MSDEKKYSLPFAVSDDGLFINPNEGQILEENSADITLASIKEDTGAIRDLLFQQGGALIEQMAQVEKSLLKSEYQARKDAQMLEKAVKNGLLLLTKKQKDKAKPYSNDNSATGVQENTGNPVKAQLDVVNLPHSKVVEESSLTINELNKRKTFTSEIKNQGKYRHNEKKQLPEGWRYDKEGRVRDQSGRYVSVKELKKLGLHHNSSGAKPDTEQEANQRRLLDALSGLQDAVESPEQLDPMIEAFNEVSEPFKGAFNVGKQVTEVIGRGGALFSRQSKSNEQITNDSNNHHVENQKDQQQAKTSRKSNEKYQLKVLDFFRRILKGLASKSSSGGDNTTGFLGLGSLLGGGLGLKMGFPNIFKGLFKGGKRLLKKIPILGALYSIVDGVGGLFDDSKDEDGHSNRGKRVGGAIGAVAGGAVGSFFGPIGSVAGAMLGDILGEKVGVWLADLNWDKVGETISTKWNETTQWLSQTWVDSLSWFSQTFTDLSQNLKKTWGNVQQKISDVWKNALDSMPSLEELKFFGREKITQIKDFSSQAWNTLKEWVSSESVTSEQNKQSVSSIQHSSEEAVTEQKQTISKLEVVSQWLSDIYRTLSEKEVNNTGLLDSNGLPIASSMTTVNAFTSGTTAISTAVQNAANYAATHSAATSLKRCAEFVNNALRAQGIASFGHGKDVATNLINSKQGFEQIEYNEHYKPQIGDVMSMASHSQSKHHYGHVAIYTEKGWVSDFTQGEKYGNTGAASAQYWSEIQSGKIKPVIARQSPSVSSVSHNTERFVSTDTSTFSGFGVDVDSYIHEAAEKYGMDESMLRGFVKMEGGWTGKMSPTGAIGTGQFIKGAWNDLAATPEGQAIGMTAITSENYRTANDPRYNKRINTLATALLAKKNASMLQKAGIEATGENLYLAHNIGASGFIRAYQGRETAGDIKNMQHNGMKGNMSARDFIAFQKSRYQRHYEQANNIKRVNVESQMSHVLEGMPTGFIPASGHIQEVNAPVLNFKIPPAMNAIEIANQVLNEIQKNHMVEEKVVSKHEKNAFEQQHTQSPDFAWQLLTQDLSDRTIAHIVTGGIYRGKHL